MGETVTVAIRPENVMLLAASGPDSPNQFSGTVDAVVYVGNLLDCVIAVGAERVRLQLQPSTQITRGTEVRLLFPIEHCLALRP